MSFGHDPIIYWFSFENETYAPVILNGDRLSFRDDSVGATEWVWKIGDQVFSVVQNPYLFAAQLLEYNSEIVFPYGNGSLEGVYLPVTLIIDGSRSKTRNIEITPWLP